MCNMSKFINYTALKVATGGTFSSRYFQSCVVDKLGHVTHHQLAKHLLTMEVISAFTVYTHTVQCMYTTHTSVQWVYEEYRTTPIA